MENKKLYRSKTDKTIAGVCGGLAKYLNLDVALVRVLWVVISLCTAAVTGLVIYAVCCAVIPEEPDNIVEETAEAEGE